MSQFETKPLGPQPLGRAQLDRGPSVDGPQRSVKVSQAVRELTLREVLRELGSQAQELRAPAHQGQAEVRSVQNSGLVFHLFIKARFRAKVKE